MQLMSKLLLCLKSKGPTIYLMDSLEQIFQMNKKIFLLVHWAPSCCSRAPPHPCTDRAGLINTEQLCGRGCFNTCRSSPGGCCWRVRPREGGREGGGCADGGAGPRCHRLHFSQVMESLPRLPCTTFPECEAHVSGCRRPRPADSCQQVIWD